MYNLLGEKNIVILSIETSCDETAAAVLSISPPSLQRRGRGTLLPKINTLSSIVKSQISIHKSFGGVVPEVAARAHVKYIRPVVEKALLTAHCPLSTIDYIAVTAGPGLLPSLLVGVEFAKALSFATNIPIIPVNHMLGHLYSPLKNLPLSPSPLPQGRGQGEGVFPIISLIVSGGHTILVLQKNIRDYKILGQTVDDAAGEAFDKVAKMLNLPYPGGPEVSKLANDGDSQAINFPRPMIHDKNYNFSFSGLKTAVLYFIRDKGLRIKNIGLKADICASFQQAVVDVLVSKTMRAVKEFKAKSVSVSGGVSANKKLRDELNLKSKILNLKFFVPPMNLCTDNAEMIGLAAAFMLHNGKKPLSYKKIKANPNMEL